MDVRNLFELIVSLQKIPFLKDLPRAEKVKIQTALKFPSSPTARYIFRRYPWLRSKRLVATTTEELPHTAFNISVEETPKVENDENVELLYQIVKAPYGDRYVRAINAEAALRRNIMKYQKYGSLESQKQLIEDCEAVIEEELLKVPDDTNEKEFLESLTEWLLTCKRWLDHFGKQGAVFLNGYMNPHDYCARNIAFPGCDMFEEEEMVFYRVRGKVRFEDIYGFVYAANGKGGLKFLLKMPRFFYPHRHFTCDAVSKPFPRWTPEPGDNDLGDKIAKIRAELEEDKDLERCRRGPVELT